LQLKDEKAAHSKHEIQDKEEAKQPQEKSDLTIRTRKQIMKDMILTFMNPRLID
jgi:hypothetical protein